MRSVAYSLTMFVLILIACASVVQSAVPPIISYQGRLLAAAGAPAPDGTVAVRFAIYDVPTGGTPLWSEPHTALQVKGGLFATMLGSIVNLPANIFDSPSRFMGVKVGDDTEMLPRQQIASVPFAYMAESAELADTVKDGAITTAKLAAGAVTSGKIADGAVNAAKLADGAISQAKIAEEDWVQFTPSWSSDGNPPSGGGIWGRYVRIGKTIIYKGRLWFNESTVFGSGRWMVSLPIPANISYSSFGIARGILYNTGNWVGCCFTATENVLQFSGPTTGYEWTPDTPFKWTPGSLINWEITYEAK